MLEILVFILTALVAAYFFIPTNRPKNFPPGPPPWPVVGNMFQMSFKRNRHEEFAEMSKKYGDIVGILLGSKLVVVLNNYKHIREAFNELPLAGRDISRMILRRNLGGNRGVLLSDGPAWLETRRFTLKTLRDFGFGKKSMEALIMEEVNELIANFKKELGQPISTTNRFNIAVLNGLWSILSGERFSHQDPKLNSLIQALTRVVSQRSIISDLARTFEFVYKVRQRLSWLFPNPGKTFGEQLNELINTRVAQHRETLQEDSPRDFIDVYLTEIKRTHDPNSSFYEEEGILSLKVVIMDLFIAGAETTSTTLTWAFLTFALYQDKQEKLYQEIKKVVGLSRHVSLTDRPNLPYLEATVMEILRFSSIVSIGVPHKAHEDVAFHGYTIPKGTLIIGNLYEASRNNEAWEGANKFEPERFITEEGKCVVRNDAFMPFSQGRRICLGETLAKDELFLFIGNIFQQLKVITNDQERTPLLEPSPDSATVLVPPPHKLVLLER